MIVIVVAVGTVDVMRVSIPSGRRLAGMFISGHARTLADSSRSKKQRLIQLADELDGAQIAAQVMAHDGQQHIAAGAQHRL